MSEFTLYCFAQSGNAYKAALMLNLCGADWSPRFVDFFNGEHRKPEYLAVNEMGEVPVLEHNGLKISQSGVILDYLSETLNKFGPENDAERREILRWTLWDNHKFTSYLATYRFLLNFMKVGQTPVTEFLWGRLKISLKILENHLGKSTFIIGDRLTTADLSICGYLYWPDEFGVNWNDYPNIDAWLKRISAQDNWVAPYDLMPGHPLPETNS